ncbi:MAG: MFS transporter [Anaerolineae bacterium]|nr:MFS transporter [Anaerolineae bacterium]
MQRKYVLVVACAALFGLGVLASVMGPALDSLAEKTGTDLGDMGTLVAVGFSGALVAQLGVGPLNDRFGQRPVLLAAVFFLAPAAVGIALSPSYWLVLAFGVMWGLGFGSIDVTSNVMVSSSYHGNVGVMNLLHVFFGIGSVIGPALVSLSLVLTDDATLAFLIGAALILLLLPFALRLPRDLGVIEEDKAQETNTRFSYRVPLLWILGAMILLYVGIEAGIGTWTTAYIERTTPFSEEEAALVTSAYWFALTGGRVAGALWGNRFTPYQVLWFSLIGAVAGGLLLALSTGNAAISIAATVMLGFFHGPPFPTIIGITTEAFPRGPGRAAGLVAAMGGVGGAAMPWIQGQLLDDVSPESSVIWIAVNSVIMLILYISVRSSSQRRARHLAAESQPRFSE